MVNILLLNGITFLSAFLLFQIELIIAKILLPVHGGSYLVWGACLVFFQLTLLAGYYFAHRIICQIGIARYRVIHLVVSALPLLFFPGRPLAVPAVHPQVPMVADVFGQLLTAIGPVFFVLSTISLVWQSWLTGSTFSSRMSPYSLFAASNSGSLLAVLTYPLLFEFLFDLPVQLNIWRAGYFILLILQTAAYFLIPVRTELQQTEIRSAPVESRSALAWFLWGAAGAIVFLSFTHIITLECAPIPLLWIIPLSIYLITFILSFKKSPWFPSWLEQNVDWLLGGSLVLYFLTVREMFPILIVLGLHMVVVFFLCLFCQRQLYLQRPADTANLTRFYVFMSVGSFAGSLAVTWLVPVMSKILLEYFLGLLVISAALCVDRPLKRIKPVSIFWVVCLILILVSWPLVFRQYNVFAVLMLIYLFMRVFAQFKTDALARCVMLLIIALMSSWLYRIWFPTPILYSHRNYYGIYKVITWDQVLFLRSGSTDQGGQYLAPSLARQPLMYYHPRSVVGEIMTAYQERFENIALVGLGTGVLAAYAQQGDTVDAFELDPDVHEIADKFFTYLRDSPARTNVRHGDARLALDKIPSQYYDVIIVDAFNGDAIPVHLLTTQAILKYKEKIKDNGLVLFHVTNRFMDLTPVLRANAAVVKAYGGTKHNDFGPEMLYHSWWVAYTWDQGIYQGLLDDLHWTDLAAAKTTALSRPWTDEYSNPLAVVRMRRMLNELNVFISMH